MELVWLSSTIKANLEYILLWTIGLLLLCLLVFIIFNVRLRRLLKRYDTLLQGMAGKNLEDIMLANREMIESSSRKLNRLEQDLVGVEQALTGCISKVGIIRFNAFPNMGSDLSFCVALLDAQGSGVVVTGLTGRQDCRTYAKPIIAGKSAYQMMEEETQAIQQAFSK